MKIEINWLIVPLGIYLFVNKNMDTYIIFMIFVVLHELAHITVGKLNGWKIKKIVLNPLGLNMEMYYYGKRKSKIVYFLSGPILNLIVAIFSDILCKKYLNTDLIEKIRVINYALCFFNLIPILPLDGGKIIREFLLKIYGISKANRISIQISKLFLFIISFLYSIVILKIQNLIVLIVFIYLWYLFYMEDKKYELYNKIENKVKIANN